MSDRDKKRNRDSPPIGRRETPMGEQGGSERRPGKLRKMDDILEKVQGQVGQIINASVTSAVAEVREVLEKSMEEEREQEGAEGHGTRQEEEEKEEPRTPTPWRNQVIREETSEAWAIEGGILGNIKGHLANMEEATSRFSGGKYQFNKDERETVRVGATAILRDALEWGRLTRV